MMAIPIVTTTLGNFDGMWLPAQLAKCTEAWRPSQESQHIHWDIPSPTVSPLALCSQSTSASAFYMKSKVFG